MLSEVFGLECFSGVCGLGCFSGLGASGWYGMFQLTGCFGVFQWTGGYGCFIGLEGIQYFINQRVTKAVAVACYQHYPRILFTHLGNKVRCTVYQHFETLATHFVTVKQNALRVTNGCPQSFLHDLLEIF